MIAADPDTLDAVIVDPPAAPSRPERFRLWSFLDIALRLHAWATIWARDYSGDVELDTRQWVGAHRSRGLRVTENWIIDETGRLRVLAVVDATHRVLLSIHFERIAVGAAA